MTDYFISDAHLYPQGKAHPGRVPLHNFLKMLTDSEPGRLWILGDLFDYWFEYSHLIPAGYSETLCLLKTLSERGWQTFFMPGNHDYWCGDNLQRASGMTILRGAVHRETVQGRSCLMSHGDGLGKGDTGYRIIKPFLRSPVTIRLFSILHPSAATLFATLFSNTSRRILRKKIDTVPDYLSRWVEKQQDSGVELVVTGHTHCPSVTLHDGITHASLGDWISHFTYLTIRGGDIHLNEFKQ